MERQGLGSDAGKWKRCRRWLGKASGGFGIYRWDGGGWDQVPGGGIGISKTVEKGPVYVVNELGKIYIHKTH